MAAFYKQREALEEYTKMPSPTPDNEIRITRERGAFLKLHRQSSEGVHIVENLWLRKKRGGA